MRKNAIGGGANRGDCRGAQNNGTGGTIMGKWRERIGTDSSVGADRHSGTQGEIGVYVVVEIEREPDGPEKEEE